MYYMLRLLSSYNQSISTLPFSHVLMLQLLLQVAELRTRGDPFLPASQGALDPSLALATVVGPLPLDRTPGNADDVRRSSNMQQESDSDSVSYRASDSEEDEKSSEEGGEMEQAASFVALRADGVLFHFALSAAGEGERELFGGVVAEVQEGGSREEEEEVALLHDLLVAPALPTFSCLTLCVLLRARMSDALLPPSS